MSAANRYDLSKLEQLVTGRERSIFDQDFTSRRAEVANRLDGSSIAIIGAAGSIGVATTFEILKFRPHRLVLFDLSENGLVEVVRKTHASGRYEVPRHFNLLPVGLGSQEFQRFFADSPQFDYVLNLAAMKHVRSEKSIYSIMRMIDVNVGSVYQFLQYASPKRFFSVSSDKSVNPANVMGATKNMMEQAMSAHADHVNVSSARFANVSFSYGSLLDGFLSRIMSHEPLSGPSDTQRYFISHAEAAQLCVMSAVLGENMNVYIPTLSSELDQKGFPEIAAMTLKHFGYEPVFVESAEHARALAGDIEQTGRYPCFFSPSTTPGEKPFEEFYHQDTTVDESRYQSIGIDRLCESKGDMSDFLEQATEMRSNEGATVEGYRDLLQKHVPGYRPVAGEDNLDSKI